MAYRTSRNIEASIIDFLDTEISAAFSGINIEKTFARVYNLDLPTVCIRLSDSTHNWTEIGEDSTWRTALVLIDIFATSDGQRLDLKDFIVEKVRAGFPYYEYVISGGSIQSKTPNGRIRVTAIDDTPVNFDTDKSALEIHDRYRHMLTLTISLGRVEAT